MILEQDAMIENIQTDPMAIGFVRLADVLGTDNNLIGNLQFLPMDRNENGVLDYNEKIYANVNEFKRGVWIGKYPQSLITNIYAATGLNTNNQAVTGFLNWMVTDGQKWMEPAGYTELVYNERQMKLEKINPAVISTEARETEAGNSFLVVIISLVAVVAGFVAFMYYFRTGKVKKAVLQAVPQLQKTLNEQTFEIPNGLYFDKSHTWIFMEKDGQVKIGIDDFIPKVTGRFTRIVMKNPGDTVKRKEPVVQLIQHGKQISIYSPVSGTITDINEDLVTSPDNINNSPYEDGWIYQVEPSNWLRESGFFKLGLQYREWIKSELNRLKDFVACSHNLQLVPNAAVAFQEGGEITAQPLKEMSPELWEDFQTYFIDTADMY
jgi:glycine cleavage system H lipoate-binding protein